MCGITVIIDQKNRAVQKEELQAATDLVAHRGPDNAGYFFGENFAFGHRRLSILDLSEKGHQPFHYENRYTISYNGEVYNYVELKKQLIAKGYAFESDTDTEVILAAYDYWGNECVQHFNGMWAFAIYDKKENQLFCSRDRFGIKPFYYSLIGHKFCIASEIKQFTAIENWSARLNKVQAYEFLALGYHDHHSATFFEGVEQLRGGHNLVYKLQDHSFKIEQYYDIREKVGSSSLSFEEAKNEFYTLFTDSIRLRLRSDVKVGTSLSGGLDSSAVVCVMHELLKAQKSAAQQESVSACFPNFKIDESQYVDDLSKQIGLQSHKVFPNFEGLKEQFDRLCWHQDEPVASASVFAQHLVFQTAKENNLTVMLDGQGADEILAGYDKFYAPYFKTLIKKNPLKAASELFRYFSLHSENISTVGKAVFKNNKPRFPIDWLTSDFIIDNQKVFKRSVDTSVATCSTNLLTEIGLSVLLHYEDRNSMAASVESRLPFMDYRLVEFCLSLPDDFKIRQAKRKYIMREALQALLPKSIYGRYDKIGFATPQEIWMREQASFFRSELERVVQALPFIKDQTLVHFDAFIAGTNSDYHTLWRVFAFGRWMEVFKLSAT